MPASFDPRPERVVVGAERRPRHAPYGDRTGHHADDDGARVEDPFELGDRRVDVDEGEVRQGVDPAQVVVAPVLVEPPVEGREGGDARLGVVVERHLHPDGERRQQPGPLDVHRVHRHEPGVAVDVLGVIGERLDVAQPAQERLAGAGLAQEVVGERPGLADRDRRSGWG